jgi:hypothetical protein
LSRVSRTSAWAAVHSTSNASELAAFFMARKRSTGLLGSGLPDGWRRETLERCDARSIKVNERTTA